MGYYVTLIESDWRVPETPEVLQALKDMNRKYNGVKRGGGGGQEWFSWMPADYDQTVASVADVFGLLGFEYTVEDGFVSLYGYSDKTGQEDLFLAETAPFVARDSYMIWQGEEGDRWRLGVDSNGHMTVASAVVTFPDPKPYTYAHYSFRQTEDGEWTTTVKVIDPYEVPLPS